MHQESRKMTKNWVRYHQNRVLTRCNLIETQFWWYLTQFLVIFLDSWCVLKAPSSKTCQTAGYNWFFAVFFGPGLVFWVFPFMVDQSSLWSIPKYWKNQTRPDPQALCLHVHENPNSNIQHNIGIVWWGNGYVFWLLSQLTSLCNGCIETEGSEKAQGGPNTGVGLTKRHTSQNSLIHMRLVSTKTIKRIQTSKSASYYKGHEINKETMKVPEWLWILKSMCGEP